MTNPRKEGVPQEDATYISKKISNTHKRRQKDSERPREDSNPQSLEKMISVKPKSNALTIRPLGQARFYGLPRFLLILLYTSTSQNTAIERKLSAQATTEIGVVAAEIQISGGTHSFHSSCHDED